MKESIVNTAGPPSREDLWNAWVARGRQHDRASERIARIVTVLAAIAIACTGVAWIAYGKPISF